MSCIYKAVAGIELDSTWANFSSAYLGYLQIPQAKQGQDKAFTCMYLNLIFGGDHIL